MAHPSPYASLTDIESWTKSYAAGGVDIHSEEASELEWLLSASSICIDKHCRRVFYKSVEGTRDIFPSWSPSTDIYLGDTLSISRVQAVLVGGDSLDIDPVPYLVPNEIPYEPSEYMRLGEQVDRSVCPQLRVTGIFGWSEVPDDVRLACVLLTRRYLSRPSSPTGAGGIGGFLVTMDPDTSKILAPYRNWKTE